MRHQGGLGAGQGDKTELSCFPHEADNSRRDGSVDYAWSQVKARLINKSNQLFPIQEGQILENHSECSWEVSS